MCEVSWQFSLQAAFLSSGKVISFFWNIHFFFSHMVQWLEQETFSTFYKISNSYSKPLHSFSNEKFIKVLRCQHWTVLVVFPQKMFMGKSVKIHMTKVHTCFSFANYTFAMRECAFKSKWIVSTLLMYVFLLVKEQHGENDTLYWPQGKNVTLWIFKTFDFLKIVKVTFFRKKP